MADDAVETGWQDDGSYVPCSACMWEPPKRPPHRPEPPGIPIYMPGTTHYGDCPTIPRMSKEDAAKLQADLDEMEKCRRRAWAEARNFVIY